MQNPMAHDELVKWQREPGQNFIREQAQLKALGHKSRQLPGGKVAFYLVGIAAIVLLFVQF